MTVPTMMNCPHSGEGWCLSCVQSLQREIERLREGKFTPSELQNLCHNLTPSDLDAFRKGCEDYTAKLFGLKPPKDEEERAFLKSTYGTQVACCCDCGEDYPKADHMIDGILFCSVCREKPVWKTKKGGLFG